MLLFISDMLIAVTNVINHHHSSPKEAPCYLLGYWEKIQINPISIGELMAVLGFGFGVCFLFSIFFFFTMALHRIVLQLIEEKGEN